MTRKKAKARLAEIGRLVHDAEEAHRAEDQLWLDVLREVAKGNPNSQALAAIAIQSVAIDFSRWYS